MKSGFSFASLFIWLLLASPAVEAEAVQPVDFAKQVAPVLEKKCLSCHNPNNSKGDISLSTIEEVFHSELELVIPGKALESDLYLVATPDEPGEKPYMPDEGEPLTEEEAKLLERWINEGAKWPDGLVLREASKADQTWWAYQQLTKPKHGKIDAYIDEQLAEDGLKRNGEADRRVLIRRATYDLHGLPPTPEEVEAFVKDQTPEAYENLIDRLLASPRYGERWGRHWLDVVRFGESNGFERNVIIDNLWPFRDYVIESINADKPFDQFIREHIAGDVIGKGNPDVEVGSAFLVAGPYDNVGNQDVVQKAQIRANTLDEIISATSQAFLGMTVGCARCHDHKFDPIKQSDYYQLYATFAGVKHGQRTLATEAEKNANRDALAPLTAKKAEIEAEKKAVEKAIDERGSRIAPELEKGWVRPVVDRMGTEEVFSPVSAKFVRIVSEATDRNANSGAGFRIDEFEVWSADEKPVNVALAANGGEATGAARTIEDFPNAYGPQLAIDGKVGARFISTSNTLTIELKQPTRINRVLFSSAKGEETPTHSKFNFVGEYRIEISSDGKSWAMVAHGRDRKPPTGSHRTMRLRREVTTPDDSKKLTAIQKRLIEVNREIAAVPALKAVWVGQPDPALAKGPFHLFVGGSPQKKGEEVVPASLSTLEQVTPTYELPADASEAERRKQLGEWITHPDNPLPARVLANRLWHYHFGTGIVDTPNDFGYMGGRPSHPELLDFLAAKLKENGWRLKPMHRMIMLSETYRQSSAWRKEAADVDGDSRLLWRFPPRRLSAEEIRDTVLAVSGKLDRTMGGQGFRLFKYMQDNVATYEPLDEHGPETYRRAVYHQNARASVVDLMTDFDQPDCAFSAPRRAETTTPLQALTMLNHSFTIDTAKALAERTGDSAGASAEDQVKFVFQIAYQREPDAEELTTGMAAVSRLGLEAFCRALLNSSELIYLD
jgi:hypothetical protein